jgi:phospholipase/carboxylesterase
LDVTPGKVDWVYRTTQPEGSGPYPVILLLHGWTGDENSMWVFTPRLPDERLLIAPRGLYPAPQGGYAWHKVLNGWPRIEHFEEAVEALDEWLTPTRFPAGDFSELHLVGFSQGAALAYAFTVRHPERVASLSALSGFLPEGTIIETASRRLTGLPVFITHGTKDALVPVDQARKAAETFDRAGAEVTYCEHDVGHKLSASCFRGLEVFFRGLERK